MADIKIEEKIVSVSLVDKNRDRITPARPKDLKCDIHRMKVKGDPHIVLVGILDEKPYELFVTHSQDIDAEKHQQGVIRKVKKGKYELIVQNGEQRVAVSDIGKHFDSEYGTLSRFISMSLRHSVPIPFIIDQLSKDKNFSGFARSVSRVLKKYIQEGEKVFTSETCPVCGGTNLIYVSGCKSCASCGWSKCD